MVTYLLIDVVYTSGTGKFRSWLSQKSRKDNTLNHKIDSNTLYFSLTVGASGSPAITGATEQQVPQVLLEWSTPPGAVGASGTTGTTGTAGAPGSQGTTGVTRAQGIQGITGALGSNGATGATGAATAAGPTGKHVI